MIRPKNEVNHKYIDILKTFTTYDVGANFIKTYTQNIIEVAEDYTLSIDRFNIPMTGVPLFIFPSHQTGGIYDTYSVELSYNGIYSGRVYVQYISTTPNSPTTTEEYYYVYTFDIFLKMVNIALETALTQLGGKVTLPGTVKKPFVSMDYTNNILSITADQADYDSYNALIIPVKVYMNQSLWSFFNGPPIIEVGDVLGTGVANGRDAQFLFFDCGYNTVTIGTGGGATFCYKMNSNYGASTAIDWNDAKGFALCSNLIPTQPEILPTASNSGDLVNRGILANFDFIYTQNDVHPLTAQYVLTSSYKLIDLIGRDSIKQLDVSVFWYDNQNNFHPVRLLNAETLSIRFVFIKKGQSNSK
jgi:hypothetical protein